MYQLRNVSPDTTTISSFLRTRNMKVLLVMEVRFVKLFKGRTRWEMIQASSHCTACVTDITVLFPRWDMQLLQFGRRRRSGVFVCQITYTSFFLTSFSLGRSKELVGGGREKVQILTWSWRELIDIVWKRKKKGNAATKEKINDSKWKK